MPRGGKRGRCAAGGRSWGGGRTLTWSSLDASATASRFFVLSDSDDDSGSGSGSEESLSASRFALATVFRQSGFEPKFRKKDSI